MTDTRRALEATPPLARGPMLPEGAAPAMLVALAFAVATSLPVSLGASSTPPALAGSLLLAAVLIALSAIDWATCRLPDSLTLPLAVAGLVLVSSDRVFDHAAAALASYAVLAGLAWVFERIRGYPGLGLGDAKLTAAGAAWLGPEGPAQVVLMACVLAIVFALARGLRNPATWRVRLPFGPFLAAGIWITWLYGPTFSV